MIDLLPIMETATNTVLHLMKQWFAEYPPGMLWTIASDYCIGDDGKKNDVFSFVVIANHDKTENISEYISAVAPYDIKNIQQVPSGLMQYLKSPVTFSLSFVIDRRSALLRDYLDVENMSNFIPEACKLIEVFRGNSQASDSFDPAYFDEVLLRLKVFEQDLARKNPNAKLSRQIHLASGFAAMMFYIVKQSTQAGYLRWISDRDKLIDHNDTVVYDLAYIYFALMLSNHSALMPNDQGKLVLEMPKIFFELPERTGQHRFDALIRLPDYLAGTLADIGPNMSYSKRKFGEMFHNVLVDSANNCVVQLTSSGERITCRSIQYR